MYIFFVSESLSSFDLSTLIFTRKYISATFEPKFKVADSLGEIYEIDIGEIQFKTLSKELKNIESIDLDELSYCFEIPPAGKWYKYLKMVQTGKLPEDTDLDLLYLASCLEFKNASSEMALPELHIKLILDRLLGTSQSNAAVIFELVEQLTRKTEDIVIKTKGGESVIRLDPFFTDLFRLALLNRGASSVKVNYK